ncbi:MAG: hypothetical protein QXX87_03625 [Candidatus Jordarchaeales archaeon]
MDGLSMAFAVLFSILYPLVVVLLLRRWRFSGESLKPVLVAFIVAAVMFYVAYLRKLYVLFLGGLALYGVDLLATGFIEEAAKLLVLLIPLVRASITPSNGAFYGLSAGLGFGSGEALLVLAGTSLSISTLTYTVPLLWYARPFIQKAVQEASFIALFFAETQEELMLMLIAQFTAPELLLQLVDLKILLITYSLVGLCFTPQIFSLPALAVYERAVVVLLHGSLTGIVGWGLAKNQTAKFYLAAVGLHILVDLFAVLYQLNVLDILTVEAVITVITLALLLYVARKFTQLKMQQ